MRRIRQVSRAGPALVWVVAMLALLVAAAAWGAEGDFLWMDPVDLGGDNFVVSVAAGGGVVVAAGQVNEFLHPDGDWRSDWLVRAVEAQTGVYKWQDHLHQEGHYIYASQVVMDAGRVFAVGGNEDIPTGDEQGIIRAFDAATGTLLWSTDFYPGAWSSRALKVAALNGRVVVVGRVIFQVGLTYQIYWLIRAYEAQGGIFLWEDIFRLEDDNVGFHIQATAVCFGSQGQVFVGGLAGKKEVQPPNKKVLLVRAYDAVSGAFQWQQTFDEGFTWGYLFEIKEYNGKVFVLGVGTTDTDPPIRYSLIRAFAAPAGTPKWRKKMSPGAGGDEAFFRGLEVYGGKVFVAGSRDSGSKPKGLWQVRAFNAGGTQLWQSTWDPGGAESRAYAVAAAPYRVYVAGSGRNASNAREWLVRAHRAGSNAKVWEDRFDLGGGDSEAYSIAASEGRVFAAGYGTNGSGRKIWVVRAYQGKL